VVVRKLNKVLNDFINIIIVIIYTATSLNFIDNRLYKHGYHIGSSVTTFNRVTAAFDKRRAVVAVNTQVLDVSLRVSSGTFISVGRTGRRDCVDIDQFSVVKVGN